MTEPGEIDPNTTVYDNPAYDPDADDQEEEEEVDRTWQPTEEDQEEINRRWQQQQGATGSDPGAESHEMANMGSETDPLLEGDALNNRFKQQQSQTSAWNDLKVRYPDADKDALEAFYVENKQGKRKLWVKMVGNGKSSYQLETQN